MYKVFSLVLMVVMAVAGQQSVARPIDPLQPLKVSPNGRYFMTADGKPFFWLGDTDWLLFSKLKREEAIKLLDDRQQKGFNVIQVMLLHTAKVVNAYGDTAVRKGNVGKPITTPGANPDDAAQYDYWDHVDFVVKAAAERGIYVAMVPVWGSVVKEGHVSPAQAKLYAAFLANRYKSQTNVIWMNGGDIKGTDSIAVWKTIGRTLHEKDPGHLVTFHPRGRTTSSIWFHNEPWLQFNVFQSGHRRYSQDTSKGDLHFGEDNWKYVAMDYIKKPAKPTFDAEPSYEEIPQGLHDSLEKRWSAADVRRYAYWSVFAGACGYTYGDNAVMQMHRPHDKDANYGVFNTWYEAMLAPGSGQMQYIKDLMLSRSYFDRVPDQSLIAGEVGVKYNRLLATRGKNYAMFYTYNGRSFSVKMDKLAGKSIKASWYNPRDGKYTEIGSFENKGVKEFDAPGDVTDGNDWVLVLDF
ncbi:MULTISPECIES: glycoside hydrolase family 140 protein [Niastella]|uniref:Glycoside hydrolase family 140 protein n=1 Tax=Niastella soli TaxID=2821487 RepID=A0ABS3Z1K7_9BACT|nr:glycoside hydrolase family 140 protein [Niastella soli]MBO9204052.1 glycoside hydrolase family 140 protein [Niastella soli]